MSKRPILLVGCQDQIEAKRMYAAAMDAMNEPSGTSWVITVVPEHGRGREWAYKVRSLKSRIEVSAIASKKEAAEL